MSFSAAWLTLREPYDARARNADVLAAMTASFAGQSAVSVVDLACGTGSTLRATTAHLPPQQHWTLFDNDLSLLARAGLRDGRAGVTVMTKPVDLSVDLEAALDGAVDLVTTSALLDLVSAEWLERFVVETAARRLPVYAALSYDGRARLEPADPFDAAVVAAVNRHQLTDKGFGPALGPEAAQAAIARFATVGYAVVQGKSDWAFGPDDREIQREVLSGWAAAARELGDSKPADIIAWLTRRHAHLDQGRSEIEVGHVDFFARPTGTR